MKPEPIRDHTTYHIAPRSELATPCGEVDDVYKKLIPLTSRLLLAADVPVT